MSRILFVDPIGGAGGDMLLAALLDAGAPEVAVRSAVAAALQGRCRFDLETVRRAGLRARYLEVAWEEGGPSEEAEGRSVDELVALVEAARLDTPVRDLAVRVLRRLAAAEAVVHGLDEEDLRLHQAGDDDTVLDVVGIAAALEALGVDRLVVGPVPLGVGPGVPSPPGHGAIPSPPPVTVELLRGFVLRGQGSDESVTPTAAAVFAALGESTAELPAMTLGAVGYGAGTRDPADRPNVVRVLLGEAGAASPAGPGRRDLVLLEANLDDLTPELVADAARALRAAGALDVWTTAAQMKKGRLGSILSSLCDPELQPALERVYFETTSTFGVRSRAVSRAELDRRVLSVPVEGGDVRVKLGLLGGRVVTATPEHDDVAAVAQAIGRPARLIYEEAVAAARQLRTSGAEA